MLKFGLLLNNRNFSADFAFIFFLFIGLSGIGTRGINDFPFNIFYGIIFFSLNFLNIPNDFYHILITVIFMHNELSFWTLANFSSLISGLRHLMHRQVSHVKELEHCMFTGIFRENVDKEHCKAD